MMIHSTTERVVPDGKESDFGEDESISFNKREQEKDDLIVRLRTELTIQSKINTDLKKLLVASVGDDIESRVETLIRTKAVLSHDITDYTNKISTDSETLDQLTIQADMWRSKFLANKLTIEKMDVETKNYRLLWNRIEKLIIGLLNEVKQVNDVQMTTHRNLKFIRDSLMVDKLKLSSLKESSSDTLELSKLNLSISSIIRKQLLGDAHSIDSVLDRFCVNKRMPNERQLLKVMNENDKLHTIRPADTANSICSRFSLNVNYDNVTLNCCKHCTSEIYVV